MFLNFQINMFVQDVEPCVSFYKAIGFEETYRTPTEGPAEHVEVRTLGLTLGIASTAAARDVHGLQVSSEGNAMELCLWCDDVDAAFERMLQAGALAVQEPHDFQSGRLRTGWLLDPANNLLEVVQQRRDEGRYVQPHGYAVPFYRPVRCKVVAHEPLGLRRTPG